MVDNATKNKKIGNPVMLIGIIALAALSSGFDSCQAISRYHENYAIKTVDPDSSFRSKGGDNPTSSQLTFRANTPQMAQEEKPDVVTPPKKTTSPSPSQHAGEVDSLKAPQTNKSGSSSAETGYVAEGFATYYAEEFHGRKTTSGEIYNMNGISAAHPSLPMGSWVKVTHLKNNKSLIVRINDRMPPNEKGRIIDLSLGAAKRLETVIDGIAKVRLEELSPEEAAEEIKNETP